MSVGFRSDFGTAGVAEGRRRQEALLAGGEASTLDGEDYTRAFLADDQRVFLWHTANVRLRPRSPYPAFRLLGLFPSTDEAIAHGKRVAATDIMSPCALRVCSTHAWYTIPTDMFTDIAPHLAKVNRNLEIHKKVLKHNAAEFARHKAELTAREGVEETKGEKVEEIEEDTPTPGEPVPEAEPAPEPAAEKEEEEDIDFTRLTRDNKPGEDDEQSWQARCAELGTGIHTQSLSRDAEVRNQRFAVVSIMEDYEQLLAGRDEVEPGVCVWAAFETESEALLYSKKVAARELKEHDLAVVAMYEWVYPHLKSVDAVPQLYRNVELNNIMKHARTSRSEVAHFERDCVDKGLSVPCMEIKPDLEEPAPRIYTPLATDQVNDDTLGFELC